MVLVNSFWSRGTGVSGADQVAVQVLRRISNYFGGVVWVTNKSGKRFIEESGCAGKYISCTDFFDRFGVVVSYILRLIFILFKPKFYGKYKVIFSSSDFLTDVLPGFVYKAFHRNVNWVASVYHVYPPHKARRGNVVLNYIAELGQKISFALIKKADRVVCINSLTKRELTARGIKNVQIIYPGIDTKELGAAEMSNEKFEAVFMSRLKPSKGIFELIDIWHRVAAKKSLARLAIIGGGEKGIINKMEKKIRVKGLQDNIKLTGYLDNSDSYGLIKASKLFLMPSYEEGFSIAIAEAMALGAAVVAWDLDVYAEVFEDKIVTVKGKDVNQFSQKIIELLESKKRQEEYARAGREYIKKYSWDSTAKKYLDILCR